ncbi:hypothetical protein M885DRAFT_552897 [Pelagophyceae sp. CCMP2097]|nr:hypothetical protein M885DRAFT_552897 [Pelagophyceae sp. CCMP2097]
MSRGARGALGPALSSGALDAALEPALASGALDAALEPALASGALDAAIEPFLRTARSRRRGPALVARGAPNR